MEAAVVMATVWKFAFAGVPGDAAPFLIPAGARVLTAQIQAGAITLWVLVDPSRPTESRRFRISGTGWDLPFPSEYIATVQDGPFVWHVFEDK